MNVFKFKVILNGSSGQFDEFKKRLLEHTDKRRDFIDKMDQEYLNIENERVENVKNVCFFIALFFSYFNNKIFR